MLAWLALFISTAFAQPGPDVTEPRLDPKRPLRAVYQRGQTMNHFVKCLREPWRKRGSTPKSRWVSHCGYRILDPTGKVAYSHSAPRAGPFSGATVDWHIPANAPLGEYRLVGEMRGPGIRGASSVTWTFQVAAPRRAGTGVEGTDENRGIPAD